MLLKIEKKIGVKTYTIHAETKWMFVFGVELQSQFHITRAHYVDDTNGITYSGDPCDVNYNEAKQIAKALDEEYQRLLDNREKQDD